MPKDMWKIMKKRENFQKNYKHSILFALHAMYKNVEIENSVQK